MAHHQRNVVHGDIKVAKTEIKAPQVPAGELVALAEKIWAEVRASGVAAGDDEGNDRLLADLRAKHQEFATSFPVPFRWMVQAREFDARVFERFLKTQVKNLYRDRKEFLAAQGEYLVQLYRGRNPRAGSRQVGRYREAVTKSLREDDDTFMEAREAAEAEVKRLDAEVDEDRRRRVHAYLVRLKDARGGLGGAAPPAAGPASAAC